MTTTIPPARPAAMDRQPATRPSLFASHGGQAAAGDNEPIRILTYLEAPNDEGSTRPDPSSRRTTIVSVIGAVVAVVALVFATLPSGIDAPSVSAVRGMLPAVAIAPKSSSIQGATNATASVASAQADRQIDSPTAGLAALIENVPGADKPSAPSEAPVRPVAQLATAPMPEATKGDAPPPVATAGERPSPLVAHQPRNVALAAPPHVPAHPVLLTPSTHPDDLPAARSVTPAPAGNDRDVALIAALVAHSEGRSANDIRPLKATQAARATEAKRREPVTPPFDLRRDVVLQQRGVSTEELIHRCKSLGMLEGELCRWRICSGLWDTDPACKGIGPRPSSDVYSLSK